MTEAVYALGNQHAAAPAHHRLLAELLDEASRRRIRGLPNWPPRRCLDVGAGGGSIARWLADAARAVMAADKDPRHIPAFTPKLQPVRHDFATGSVLPEMFDGEQFDLVYSRMTLQHLPNRRRLLADMAARLAPGGVLLVEDWAALRDQTVIDAPDVATAELYRRWQSAVADTFDAAGADRHWARDVVYPAMREEGLADINTQVRAEYWHGGGPGLRLATTTTAQLHPKLIARGLTPAELDTIVEVTGGDRRLVVHGHPLYSTAGTRP